MRRACGLALFSVLAGVPRGVPRRLSQGRRERLSAMRRACADRVADLNTHALAAEAGSGAATVPVTLSFVPVAVRCTSPPVPFR
jgi:hypothetical protein